MENDQLVKRVKWLDEERRNDKSTISELQKRIAKLEGTIEKANEHIKNLSGEVTRLSVLVAKIDGFETALATHRAEVKREMDEQDKRRKKRESEAKKVQNLDIDSINKTLAEFHDELGKIPGLEQGLMARKREEERLGRMLAETQGMIKKGSEGESELTRMIRSLEEDQRQDAKRATDLQGEVAAMRKRTDELHARFELVGENQRKVETRLNELLAAESERRETQTAFIEKANYDQAERKRAWKEWEKRFEIIEKQSDELAARLREVGEFDRTVKQAQETFDTLSEQLERRSHEITEVQRLGEERFRQEWATFKADDQKRWANYALTQEEQQREITRQFERLVDQVTNLEDSLREVQDVVQHMNEQSEKQLQTMLANLRDWVSENERFLSTMR